MSPVQRRTTADDGTVIGWKEAGEGSPLLLVHGTAANSRQWDKLVPFLVDRFTVAAMVRRFVADSAD